MNKKDLIEAIADGAGTSKLLVERVMDAMTDTIVRELQRGGEVTIHGVGKLSVAQRAARTGRNPITGEAVEVKAKRAPKFKASITLKNALN